MSANGLRMLLSPPLVELPVGELSAIVALLRKGPLEPADLAPLLAGWFGIAMSAKDAAATLRCIEARGWLIRRAGGWTPSAAAYAPTRMLCAGLIHMLGETEAAEPDHAQLTLIDCYDKGEGR